MIQELLKPLGLGPKTIEACFRITEKPSESPLDVTTISQL
jgi:hypothetical protein